MRMPGQSKTPIPPKDLRACSNMYFSVLAARCDAMHPFTFHGTHGPLQHEGRPVAIVAIKPLQDGPRSKCRQWQLEVEEQSSRERWFITITPQSCETSRKVPVPA